LNHFDIKVESPRPRGAALQHHLEQRAYAVAAAREQSLRDLAGPYLKAGYRPSELVAIERVSRWCAPESTFAAVQIAHKRSPLRLFCRRLLMRLHLRSMGGLPWQG
jgi:hypothetical protein